MKRFGKRILAFVLVFTMVLSLVPVTAQAEGADVYTMTGTLETWKYLSVPLDASVTLTAVEEVSIGYTYQWFGKTYEDDDYTIIGEAAGADYTIDGISTKMQYYCEVYDENGSVLGQSYFEISIDSGLKGYVAGTEDGSVDMQVSKGGSITMEVDASADVGNVFYKWYQWVPEGDDILLDSTTESCTVSDINEYTDYYCEVSDDYDNWERVWFYVSVASGLYAYADVEEESNYKDVKVAQSETATLTVYAGVDEGMGDVSYEWYKDGELLEGKTESTCKTDAITTRTTYSCKVSDAYGETKNVWFYVSVDSKLTVDAVGDDHVTVPLNETTTLEVVVSVAEGVAADCQWYYWNSDIDEYELIEGATGTSFKTPVIKKDSQFKCVVRDKYGNEIDIIFTVKLATKKDDTTDPSQGTTGGNDTSGSSNEGTQTPPVGDNQQESTKPVTKLKLLGTSKKVVAGKKITLTPMFTPTDATNQQLVWSSSNTKYATVSAKGVVTTKKAGAGKSVTITATTQDGSNIKATYKISIVKHAVKSIKISAKSKTVKAGKQLKLKATVKTTGKTANKTLQWSSSNTKYATVTSKGVVKAKKAGKGKKVKITARATDGSGKKATITIKIK